MKSLAESECKITIKNAIAWTVAYFSLLLFVTLLDIVLWRKTTESLSVWLDLFTMIIFNMLFFRVLVQRTNYKINLFHNVSAKGLFAAIGCSILFYCLLDKCLDPIFESFFPMSESEYQDTIMVLKQSPVTSFLRVCLMAPFVEEILMRGYILGGLQRKYGFMIALMVSSFLFAVLHFNMVQTLSALFCGGILGILYYKTGSIVCCILAHSLYNAISYFTIVIQ